MTLTTRVSLFFLSVLALVLVGFSALLFWLAWVHLAGQVDERLEAALQTISAAAEIEGTLIDWEPTEHHLGLGRSDDLTEVRWVAFDEQGKVIDKSANVASEGVLSDLKAYSNGSLTSHLIRNHQGTWQLTRRVILPTGEETASGASSTTEPKRRYRSLTIAAALSLEPNNKSLRTLGLTLGCLSIGLWVMAALAGRWLCGRALSPVSQMALAARAMTGSDLRQRLPAVATCDELEDLSHAFNNLLDRLQESFERQRRFTGDASHQLRTPLASMLGQLEVALRRDRSAEDYQHVLGQVNSQAERLRQIVESQLFLARADAEGRLPQGERIDLVKWLDEHLATWAGNERAKDFSVEKNRHDSLYVHAQAILLGQMVDSILDNACKYSLPGNPIILRLFKTEATIALSIEDHGHGIKASDLPHVFDPFFRSSQTRLRGIPGHGLGLAIAKRIADAFGAHIEVQSTLGKGSRFALVFCQAEVEPEAQAG